MNYKLREGSDRVTYLARTLFCEPNGKPSPLFCHLTDTRRRECGEHCPMFEVDETPGGIRVMLSCVPVRRVIAIDKEN